MRMSRRERKLFAIGDRLTQIEHELTLAREELVYHQHLDDDAQRDAAVSDHPIDRADARETAGDVVRFETLIRRLELERAELEERRVRLIAKLR
ncbi:MAG: hypothetical protein QNJ88_17960 [Acidimicrobiia bacterium]|nr:hypothetical protein [Acidimicrobiia bacterium]